MGVSLASDGYLGGIEAGMSSVSMKGACFRGWIDILCWQGAEKMERIVEIRWQLLQHKVYQTRTWIAILRVEKYLLSLFPRDTQKEQP